MYTYFNIPKLMFAVVLMVASAHASAFLVSDFSQNKVDIKDHVGNGRVTIVMIWQLECVLCEKQKPALEAFHNKHKATKAHVIGLARDGHEYMKEVKAYMDKNPTDFPSYIVFGDVFRDQLLKETGKVLPGSPSYVVYDQIGTVVFAADFVPDIDAFLASLESQI